MNDKKLIDIKMKGGVINVRRDINFPNQPLDAAAVEAAKKMRELGYFSSPKQGPEWYPTDAGVASIITDCYKLRLTAEREVREEPVAALERVKGITGGRANFDVGGCHAALAEAEKLEDADA